MELGIYERLKRKRQKSGLFSIDLFFCSEISFLKSGPVQTPTARIGGRRMRVGVSARPQHGLISGNGTRTNRAGRLQHSLSPRTLESGDWGCCCSEADSFLGAPAILGWARNGQAVVSRGEAGAVRRIPQPLSEL